MLWSSQLHACCVCDMLQTLRNASNLHQSVVERFLPFVKLGSSCRKPINQHFWWGLVFLWFFTSSPGRVPWLHGHGRNARSVTKYLGLLQCVMLLLVYSGRLLVHPSWVEIALNQRIIHYGVRFCVHKFTHYKVGWLMLMLDWCQCMYTYLQSAGWYTASELHIPYSNTSRSYFGKPRYWQHVQGYFYMTTFNSTIHTQ